MNPRIENALLSVSDKTGLLPFARALVAHGVTLYASGGTRSHLVEAGLPVIEVAEYTGFPEMMDGRIKTLHPKIHGGILCRHDQPEDLQNLRTHGIVPFALVVVNLYPFEATIAKPGVSLAEAIEKIDVGGPTILRGAAKNHAFVTVCCQPSQYEVVLEEIHRQGHTNLNTRARLANEAFQLSAHYEQAIAKYLTGLSAASEAAATSASELPETLTLSLHRVSELRYGENPHQGAAVYRDQSSKTTSSAPDLVTARQLNGKELSYNNLLDLDAALNIVWLLDRPAVSVVKHNNPCGAATADALGVATRKALDGDPVSAFGSILAFNRPVDAESAEVMVEPDRFIEAIVAPDFSPEALQILTTRPKWRANVRLLALNSADAAGHSKPTDGPEPRLELRAIRGGYLAQFADDLPDPREEWNTVTTVSVPPEKLADLELAWNLVRYVKSNAIVVVRDQAQAGAGAGQMSRVDSVEIALKKAGERARGGVLASDAFFPFPDSVDLAAAAGIVALIQPGGSKKDPEVIERCNALGISMIFTGKRHFRH